MNNWSFGTRKRIPNYHYDTIACFHISKPIKNNLNKIMTICKFGWSQMGLAAD
jgi:hypothetical protein